MTFDLIPPKLNERVWLGFVCRWSWRNDASVSALLRLFPLRGQRGLLESFRSKRREHPSFNNSWFQKLRDLKALASSNYGGTGLQCERVLVFPCSRSLRSLFAFPCGGATGLETGAQLLCSVGPRWCTDAHSLETGFNFFLRPACPLRRLQKTCRDWSHLHSRAEARSTSWLPPRSLPWLAQPCCLGASPSGVITVHVDVYGLPVRQSVPLRSSTGTLCRVQTPLLFFIEIPCRSQTGQ